MNLRYTTVTKVLMNIFDVVIFQGQPVYKKFGSNCFFIRTNIHFLYIVSYERANSGVSLRIVELHCIYRFLSKVDRFSYMFFCTLNLSTSVREQTYTTMVRPTLEYASAAWDPYTSDQINQLDKVQRRAACFVSNNYRDKTPGCVTVMVKSLGWEPLKECRKSHRLVMMYKVMHGFKSVFQNHHIWSRQVTPEPEVPTD